MEENNSIPFLDVLLIHNENGSISTDWYQKKTWSGRYLNFLSSLPMTYKKNTVSILTEKILRLSDISLHKKIFKLLTETLLSNGYPRKLVELLIKNARDKLNKNNFVIEEPNVRKEQNTYVSIPYIQGLTEKIKNVFEKVNITVCGKPTNTLSDHFFSKNKDETVKEIKSNLIYQVDCNDCNHFYIGETCQYLKTRMYQHNNDSKKSDQEFKSALSNHLKEKDHKFSLQNVKIIGNEANTFKRKFKECIKIQQAFDQPDSTCLNFQTDLISLENIYKSFL